MNVRGIFLAALAWGAASSCSFYRSLEVRTDPDVRVRALQFGAWESVPEAAEPAIETDRAVYRVVQARGSVRPERLEVCWPDGYSMVLQYDQERDGYLTASGSLVPVHECEGGGVQWADVSYDWIEVDRPLEGTHH